MKKASVCGSTGRTPPHHIDMKTFPLFEKSPDGDLALSVSYYLPGGGVEMGPQPVEVIFYVLDGCITIQTEDGDIPLEKGEAIHISAGEKKGVRNNGSAPASILVIANLTVLPELPN